MKCLASLLMFSVACTVLCADKTDADPALNGTWKMISAEQSEQKMPDEQLAKMNVKLTMKDSTYTTTTQGDKGALKIDTSTTPRSIDVISDVGALKGKVIPAIYKFDGEKLIICYDFSGKTRPTTFATKKDTALFLAIYKKEEAN
jgi:uncharacterized protein (TIGR03067 family)